MRARAVIATAGLVAAALLTSTGFAMADGGADANGEAKNSPGVVSGNVIQAPVHVPVSVCGSSALNVVGLLAPAFGDECEGR